MALIFVDCEAKGPVPIKGTLTEFGAVEFETRLPSKGRYARALQDPDGSVQLPVEEEFQKVVKILLSEKPPEINGECGFCDWHEKVDGI